ncbi:TPA: lysozyme inhibitor LprI family protein [Pluralibacter gergoviae]
MNKLNLASVLTLFFLWANNSMAKGDTSIVLNGEVGECIKKFGDKNIECINAAQEASEQKLTVAFKSKLSEINHYDYAQWWMANREQRDAMAKSFENSQVFWLKYRDEYCRAVTSPVGATKDFGPVDAACHINMNNKRIQDINHVHMDISDEDY